MRIRIRSSDLRAPPTDPALSGAAFGRQDTTGFARGVAPDGGEARGVQDTTGVAQPLLVRRGVQDTTGRASARVLAFGRQDTTGFAQAGGTNAGEFTSSLVLAANDDLPTATPSNYVLELHLTGDFLKQVANGGRIADPNANDLFVESVDGLLSLDHQIDFYDGENGVVDICIRLSPDWPTNTQYPFRLRYGQVS